MNTKKIRGLLNQVRRTAARLAEKCDFCAEAAIKDAHASCADDNMLVIVGYKDNVERAQIDYYFVALRGSERSCRGWAFCDSSGAVSYRFLNRNKVEEVR